MTNDTPVLRYLRAGEAHWQRMADLPFWERYDAIRATVAGNWRKRYPLTARRLYLLTFAAGVIAAAIGAVADGVEAGEHERVG